MSSSSISRAARRCNPSYDARRRTSGIEPRSPKAVHHPTSEGVRSTGVCLASGCQRGQKDAAIFMMRETVPAPLEVTADFVHAIRGELFVEIVPELLDCAAAVDITLTLSHPSIRVGRAERS